MSAETSFPQSVERESRIFSEGTGFQLKNCGNDGNKDMTLILQVLIV
jgi:hypothetical protein